MKIIFLTQGTDVMPASRFRVFQFLRYLNKHNIKFDIRPAVTTERYITFIANPNKMNKALWFRDLLFGRLKAVANIWKYDVVFIQRETWPLIYPFVEILFAKLAKKMIFDFDDAIFGFEKKYHGFLNRLLPSDFLRHILVRCDRVIVGNRYLFEYAIQHCKDVIIIPTCIDVSEFPPISQRKYAKTGTITIGWMGSPSTSFYLNILKPVLSRLSNKYNYTFRAIGCNDFQSSDITMSMKMWDKETEIQELCGFDIGVMPLPDNKWTKGKSGTKILQYMAAGVPCVASGVGANSTIIIDGKNGYLANSEEEWYTKICQLLESEKLREKIGLQGYNTVLNDFSVQSQFDRWLSAISSF